MRTILLGILRISSSLLKCSYLKNKKHLLKFLSDLWNLHQVLNISKKNMMVIANVFPKLETVKDLIKLLSRKNRCRTSFDSQRVNGFQKGVKSAWELFYYIFWSIWGKMIWKISPILKFGILGVFVNTLIVVEKYPVPDCENLQFPIEKQLS